MVLFEGENLVTLCLKIIRYKSILFCFIFLFLCSFALRGFLSLQNMKHMADRKLEKVSKMHFLCRVLSSLFFFALYEMTLLLLPACAPPVSTFQPRISAVNHVLRTRSNERYRPSSSYRFRQCAHSSSTQSQQQVFTRLL